MSPWGAWDPTRPPPRALQERLRTPKGGKQTHSFYYCKTYTLVQRRARVNECTAFGETLESLLFLGCSCSFCFWFVVCAAVPTQLFSARSGLHLAPPGSPKAPSESHRTLEASISSALRLPKSRVVAILEIFDLAERLSTACF